MNSSTDRGLLFGILAWQNGFIATEPLLTAIQTWLHEKSKQLGEVLVQQGDLSAQQRALLEQLIDARVQQDGGDAGQSLANLSSSLPFADKLAAMHNDALAASLAKLPPAVHRAWPGSDSESHSSSESRQSDESAASDDGLHLILDRFEAAWREHVNAKDKSEEGKSAQPPAPGLENFLREVSDKQQKTLLRELLIIELHWRQKKGETPEHKSYQQRFPDWSHVVDNAFNLANGRYQVKESFAKGGLGEVFIARDLELNRPVAFKCVRADRDRDESRKRLVIEGEITGGLEHPGIVPVYGLGHFEDGRPFYAMRFIKGENLRRALRKFHGLPLEDEDPKLAETELLPESTRSSSASRSDQPVASASLFDRKRLEFRELLGRFVDVCQALAYAHDRKVLHRDLKPGNIMLGKYGETLVVDWGLAKTLGRKEELTPFDPRHTFDGPVIPSSGSDLHLTRGNAPAGQAPLIGTLGYISPEQAAGKLEELGAATDIFSLGATLFELLTGQPPIGAALPGAAAKRLTQKNVEEAARKGEFPRPRQLLPEVPAPLEAVCLKAMSFHPQDRYPTAKALAEDIERWLADEPVAVWREPFSIRAQRWMKHHRTAVTTTAATFLMSFLGVIGWGVLSSKHTREVDAKNISLQKANTKEREATQLAAKRAAENAKLAEQEKSAREQSDLNADRADAKADEARRHLYSARMNLAQRNWEAARASVTVDLLGLYASGTLNASLRGFEWHYLDRQCHSELTKLTGHTNPVVSVAFSPDGKRLASAGGWDQTVKIWETTNGQETLTLKGHTGYVTSVAFSPNGKRLASASWDKTVKVWDVTSGQETLTLKGHTHEVNRVAFSPDGRRLVSASSDQTVKVWDATSSQETLTLKGHTIGVGSVAFSTDGRRMASASGGTVKVWDATSGQETLTLKGHSGQVQCVAFSPDGKRLASASYDNTIKVWDALSGQEMLALRGHTHWVTSVAFSPEGKRLASASWDKTVKVWDATSGQETLTLKGHTGEVLGVAFSPDGRKLVSASSDQMVKVWGATSGHETLTLNGHNRPVRSVAFSPNGKWLASAGLDQTVKMWDLAIGQVAITMEGDTGVVWCLALSTDGKLLASARMDGMVQVWDAVTGQETLMLKGNTGAVLSVAFRRDGKRLASAGGDPFNPGTPGAVNVWDATTGDKSFSLKGHTGLVYSVAFSPDGTRLASASWDRTVKVWDAISGQETLMLKGHSGPVLSVAFSPDGQRLVSACGDGTVKVWDATSGVESLTLKGHNAPVNGVAFSRDGRRIASGSGDKTVKVWDAKTGQETLTLEGHTGFVTSVAFSTDGNRLASASDDRTVKVWDARPWTPDLQAERETLDLLRFQCADGIGKQELLNAIAADRTISNSVRQQAMELAVSYWENDIRSRGTPLLDGLFGKGLLKDEVIQAIAEDKTISELVRTRSLELANSRIEDVNALNDASWSIVSKSDQSMVQYRLALRRVETAHRIAPNNLMFLNTLGVAQYRVGQYEESLKTLTRSDEFTSKRLGQSRPTDVVFLTMVQNKLGHKDQARALLDRLHEIMKQPPWMQWAKNEEGKGLLREAESLLDEPAK